MPEMRAHCFTCGLAAEGEGSAAALEEHRISTIPEGGGVEGNEHSIRVEYECPGCGLEGIAVPECFMCRNKLQTGHICLKCRKRHVYDWRGICPSCRDPRTLAERARIREEGMVRQVSVAEETRTKEQIFEEERQRLQKKRYKKPRVKK